MLGLVAFCIEGGKELTGIVNEGGIRGDSPDVESNLRRDDDKSASFLFRLVDADTSGLLFNGADGVVSYE